MQEKRENQLDIGPMEVLENAAGYYIGRYCNGKPYDEISGYYQTYEQAKEDLIHLIRFCICDGEITSYDGTKVKVSDETISLWMGNSL